MTTENLATPDTMKPTLHTFVATITKNGMGSQLVVDGVDLSDQLRGFSLSVTAGVPTALTLDRLPNSGEIAGVVGSVSDSTPAAAEEPRAPMIAIRPGDVLVLECDKYTPREAQELLRAEVERVTGCKAIVLVGVRVAGVLRDCSPMPIYLDSVTPPLDSRGDQ